MILSCLGCGKIFPIEVFLPYEYSCPGCGRPVPLRQSEITLYPDILPDHLPDPWLCLPSPGQIGGYRVSGFLGFLGLARLSDKFSPQPEQRPFVLGTPSYMAPEQAAGGSIDFRADLFSLGCLLYRMATGSPPFMGPDLQSVLTEVKWENPPLPRLVNPVIPARLSDLVMRLLAKNPEDRPQSARELANLLGNMKNGC